MNYKAYWRVKVAKTDKVSKDKVLQGTFYLCSKGRNVISQCTYCTFRGLWWLSNKVTYDDMILWGPKYDTTFLIPLEMLMFYAIKLKFFLKEVLFWEILNCNSHLWPVSISEFDLFTNAFNCILTFLKEKLRQDCVCLIVFVPNNLIHFAKCN